jgi:hypothetical protein
MPITPLKRAIFESGRTQRAVAAEVGIDEAHLSRLCNGLHCAEPTRLKIAAVLGRDVDEVFVTDATQEAA